MEIERGLQPNCSELVIRLGNITEDEAKEQLAEIDVREYLIKDKFQFTDQEPTEWDEDPNIPKFVETKTLSEKIRKALKDVNLGTGDYDSAKKILADNGINHGSDSVYLLDGEPKCDKYDSGLWISKYPFESEETCLAVWYSQHCQRQGFETLKKIAEHFGSEVESHDGGSINSYESWLNGEEDDE